MLSIGGLSHQPGIAVHNIAVNDQIQQFIPWTTLAWRQVHQGHLPLWNPYSVLGMPLAFNWLSATFSVPTLIGYLVPLRLAYTAQVIVTLMIAGTGVYAFSRVLGLNVLGSAMAATTFELSGSFFGWLGWSVAGVMSWAGWLFLAGLLIVRGRHRVRAVVLLSVVMACAIYVGQPETLALLGLAFCVWIGVVLSRRVRWFGGEGPIRGPILDTILGVLGGLGLGAPLLIPGLEVVSGSLRSVNRGGAALPAHDLIHIVFQGFDGLRSMGNTLIPPESPWAEDTGYLGVIALVLAVLAVVRCWKHREVLAFAVVVVVTGVLVFVHPVVSFLNSVPAAEGLTWHRALVPMSFALAVLAGIGMHVFVRQREEGSVWSALGIGFGVIAVLLGALWLFGRGHLPPIESDTRARSFVWPAIDTAIGLAVLATLAVLRTRQHGRVSAAADNHAARRWAGLALLLGETVFLVAAGAPWWSSSATFLTATPAEAKLMRTVGSSVVGFGASDCYEFSVLGIIPNVNITSGVRELAVYDPMTPRAYDRSWEAVTGHSPGREQALDSVRR